MAFANENDLGTAYYQIFGQKQQGPTIPYILQKHQPDTIGRPGPGLQHCHRALSVAYQIKTPSPAIGMDDIVCRRGFNDLI